MERFGELQIRKRAAGDGMVEAARTARVDRVDRGARTFERMRREGGERREESRLSEFETVFPHVDVLRAGSRPDDDEGGMEVYASLLISWLHPAMWEI